MKKRVCNLCNKDIEKNDGTSFGSNYDLCVSCTTIVRRAICRKCVGTGFLNIRDDAASNAMATCGENRTQYNSVPCTYCR